MISYVPLGEEMRLLKPSTVPATGHKMCDFLETWVDGVQPVEYT